MEAAFSSATRAQGPLSKKRQYKYAGGSSVTPYKPANSQSTRGTGGVTSIVRCMAM